MGVLIPSIIIIVLVLLNGLYVAAEFGIVAAPRLKIAKRAKKGQRLARHISSILDDPQKQDRYIATAQLGITAASLGLGMYGEHAIAEALWPVMHEVGLGLAAAHAAATVITVAIITYLHVVLGEMIPKSLALTDSEQTVLWTAIPMIMSRTLLYPMVVVLNGIGNYMLKAFGVPPSKSHGQVHTPEELQILAAASSEVGLVPEDVPSLFRNLLDLPDRTIGQVMIPRTGVVGIPVDADSEEITGIFQKTRHTRYPVFNGDLDHIVGIIHVKDYLRQALRSADPVSLADIAQEPLYVPETESALWLLDRMREHRMLMAVVLDEFGGTAGVATFEDVLEEVVGEVRDEFDEQEREPLVNVGENCFRVRGDVLLQRVNDMLGLDLPADEVDTVGGVVLDELGRPAKSGDIVEVGGARLKVTDLHGRGVAEVELEVLQDPEPEED